MDPSWLNFIIGILSILVIVGSALIGSLFRMSKELSLLKTHLAEHYVSKDEFRSHTDRLEKQMESGFNRLYSVLNRRSE